MICIVYRQVSKPRTFWRTKVFLASNYEAISSARGFSNSRCSSSDDEREEQPWRKQQLDKILHQHAVKDIQTEDDLQTEWKGMERRVVNRKSYTSAERGSEKVGRKNVRRSDEDYWLEGGLYNNIIDEEISKKEE